MIKLYRLNEFGFRHDRGDRVLDLSSKPKEVNASVVELLTSNTRDKYAIDQIVFDEKRGIYISRGFAANYGSLRVDSWPLRRGFIPEGEWAKNQAQTLHEIMPKKKEIHVIPNPERQLFYEKAKVQNEFCFEGTSEEFLEEFRKCGFSFIHFPQRFNSMLNQPENSKRYEGEEE